MGRRIVAAAGRPAFWLGLLLVWTLLSAGRSEGTPWARAAGTEALRWGAGVALALALGTGLRRTRLAAQILTALLAVLVLGVLVNGLSASDMVTGLFRDHQLCASALLVLLPFSAALALAADTPRWRWGAQAVSVAAAVCLALTQTRSAWIGAAVAALVFALLWLRPNHTRSSRRPHRAWVVPALLMVGLAGGSGLIVASADLGTSLAARAQTLRAVGQDRDWRIRVQTWRGAAGMVTARPLAGWGLGRYPGAQWRWTGQGRALAPTQRPSLSEQAHDLYLQTAAETGVIGLLLYLAALGTLLVRCLQTLRASDSHRGGLTLALRVATVSLLVGQGVDALASPSYQFAEVSLLFWAGLGVGMAALHRRTATEETFVLPAPVRRVMRLSLAGAASVALTAQALPLGWLTSVEAYTAPAGYTLQSLVLTPASGNVTKGNNVTFALTAIYADSAGHTFTYNGNSSSEAGTTKYSVSPSTDPFNPGATNGIKNVLSVNDKSGTQLVITAQFMDGANVKTTQSHLTVVLP